MNNREIRYIPVQLNEQDGNSRKLEGRAIVFDSYSNNLGFYEKINRSAITQGLIDESDIIFTFNHDPNQLLARFRGGSGSLGVELREDGVYFSFDIPNTTLGNDLYELIKRGDISNCSFAFTVSKEDNSQRWEKRDGVMYREILKIDGLYDLSAVTYPAYSDTDINARSIEMRDAAEKEIEEIEEAEEKSEEKPEEREQETPVENTDKPEEREQEKPAEEQVENTDEKPEEPAEKPEEEKQENRQINKENKNNINIMNKNSLVKEIRNAIDTNQKSFTINAETRTITVQDQSNPSVDGVHDEVIETEIQGILEPLYANSVLN